MRLILTRDQNKRVLGDVHYEVHARVSLTAEEADLVRHYRLRNHVLFTDIHTARGVVGNLMSGNPSTVRVKDLLSGITFKCKMLDAVISSADNAKLAAETMRTYLELANGFGGEEVIDLATSFSRSPATSYIDPPEEQEDPNDDHSSRAIDTGSMLAPGIIVSRETSMVDAAEPPVEFEICYHCGTELTSITDLCPACGKELN